MGVDEEELEQTKHTSLSCTGHQKAATHDKQQMCSYPKWHEESLVIGRKFRKQGDECSALPGEHCGGTRTSKCTSGCTAHTVEMT